MKSHRVCVCFSTLFRFDEFLGPGALFFMPGGVPGVRKNRSRPFWCSSNDFLTRLRMFFDPNSRGRGLLTRGTVLDPGGPSGTEKTLLFR